jgi:SOR/SNZ family
MSEMASPSSGGVVTVYGGGATLVKPATKKSSTFSVKAGLAQMLRGGVIMDVINVEQARIAEEAGACAVMALEQVPADIRSQGRVARMSDPSLIREIKNAVTIPVMAKARIGHFVEAQILEAIGVDYVDESEVRTTNHMFLFFHYFLICLFYISPVRLDHDSFLVWQLQQLLGMCIDALIDIYWKFLFFSIGIRASMLSYGYIWFLKMS